MPSMQAPSKQASHLPAGYGERADIIDVVGPSGLRGALFVHHREEDPRELVATLQLRHGDEVRTFRYLGEPKEERFSRKGSKLLFRNLPSQGRNEDFDSPEFKERQVLVYEGEHGPFAITPFGIVNLKHRDPRQGGQPVQTFDMAAFRASAITMRAEMKAKDAPASGPKDDEENPLDAMVLKAVQANEGVRGARWDDVVGAVLLQDVPRGQDKPTEDDVAEALNRLMEEGSVYEPTMGILKSTDGPEAAATAT